MVGKKISHTNNALKYFDKPMYFVHSYEAICANQDNIESTYLYQDRKIVSSVKSNNVYGFQFHPERSAVNGLQILKSVLLKNL